MGTFILICLCIIFGFLALICVLLFVYGIVKTISEIIDINRVHYRPNTPPKMEEYES